MSSDDGELTVNKPNYRNASDHMIMSVTPRGENYEMIMGNAKDMDETLSSIKTTSLKAKGIALNSWLF